MLSAANTIGAVLQPALTGEVRRTRRSNKENSRFYILFASPFISVRIATPTILARHM
jgi:hypothetical protein